MTEQRDTDITRLILDDHGVFRGAFAQLDELSGADARDETLDAIGDHNEIRDAVHAAAREEVGTEGWWAAVRAARVANDEHMAEEERDGLPDFRAHAPSRLRRSLGRRFVEFKRA